MMKQWINLGCVTLIVYNIIHFVLFDVMCTK